MHYTEESNLVIENDKTGAYWGLGMWNAIHLMAAIWIKAWYVLRSQQGRFFTGPRDTLWVGPIDFNSSNKAQVGEPLIYISISFFFFFFKGSVGCRVAYLPVTMADVL
jgi:hypothetical protein